MHRDGKHIWNAIKVEGTAMLMVRGNSMGTNWKGHYSLSLLEAFARGRITSADDFFETVKLTTLLGQYMQDRYHGRYYAKAQNLARTLTGAYDDALKAVDLLVMPTTPMKAPMLPPSDAPLQEKVARASGMNGGLNANNCPFNVTGHPVMTVPCGLIEGLPIGMMLGGWWGEEATVLRAAHAFEQISGYTVRPQHDQGGPYHRGARTGHWQMLPVSPER
jgi:amidase